MAREKLEPRLAATIRGAATEPVPVSIAHAERLQAGEGEPTLELEDLGRRARRSQRPILNELARLRVTEVRSHTLANAVGARLTPAQIRALAELDEVETIRLERPDDILCASAGTDLIEATAARTEFRIDGRGVRVAVLDSGIDRHHPALSGRVVDRVSLVPEGLEPPGRHGTHVAGILASGHPRIRGVAPGAELIDVKVMTAAGLGAPGSVIDGLEQALRRGARVANLGFGWSELKHEWVCDDADCILCQAADNAVRLGLCVVVAAGNEGLAGPCPPFAIRHPAAARLVVAVGAVDGAKDLAHFSSVGPGSGRPSRASASRLTKPDLIAPGVGVVSSVPGGGFAAMTGTSMASPSVAGVAALLRQLDPRLTPARIKALLEDACEDLVLEPNRAGHGLVSAYDTLLRAAAAVATRSASPPGDAALGA